MFIYLNYLSRLGLPVLLFDNGCIVFAGRNIMLRKKRPPFTDSGAARTLRPALAALCVLLAFTVIRNAWVSDDAYINAADSGINFGKRLWIKVEHFWKGCRHTRILVDVDNFIPVFFYQGGILYCFGSCLFFITGALLSLYILKLFEKNNPPAVLAGIMVSDSILALCWKFSTSGLEKSAYITFWLPCFFCPFPPGKEYAENKRMFLLSLIAGFSAFNRIDTLILFLPLIIYEGSEIRKKEILSPVILAGFYPVLAWEIFSIIYYGFPFPNTFLFLKQWFRHAACITITNASKIFQRIWRKCSL